MTLQFAAFVVGAVLLLIAIAGGKFKVIGAELAETVKSPWLRGLAGLAGVALILWALVQPTKPIDDTQTGATTSVRHEQTHEPRAVMGDLEVGVNHQGTDISNFQAESADACSEACREDPRCRAMTFVKHPDAPGGICWLKSDVASRSPAPNMTSAVKHFEQ